jgi:hypothetical protein
MRFLGVSAYLLNLLTMSTLLYGIWIGLTKNIDKGIIFHSTRNHNTSSYSIFPPIYLLYPDIKLFKIQFLNFEDFKKSRAHRIWRF